MDQPPWTLKQQQSVATELERGDELLNNGNCDNLLETADINFNNSVNKCDRKLMENDLEAAISEKSKIKIQNILNEVNTLIPIEKLLLYLKLPSESANNVDPLRQPLNPLGSRTEITQTIMWIKTHLEEDPEISLQKKGVYDEYSAFCENKNIKPLSTADFGKVMKQVYPRVRPRRLGTRGNSQYCYSGLRKRIKLATPFLPDLSHKPLSSESTVSTMPDLHAAAWYIIKEWSENKLGSKFQSLCYLAHYLVKNHSIGVGSSAASVITSFIQNQHKGDMTSNINSNRHRETIRKIQQKYEGNQKRKMQMSQSKSEQKYRSKKAKLQQPIPTVASTDIKSTSVSPLMTVTVTSTTSICERKTSPPQGLKPVCDKSLDFTNLHTLPDFSSFQRPCGGSGDRAPEVAVTAAVTTTTSDQCSLTANTTPIGKVAIPRLTTKQQLHQQQQSPVLLQSPLRTAKNTKYKHIQPKPEQCDIATYNPQQSPSTSVGGAAEPRSQDINVGKSKRTIKKEEQNCAPSLDDDHTSELFTRERLISISNVDKDALDDYLGTNNSQENEELMSYFDQDNHEQDNPDQDTQESSKDKKLSQLRLLLEQNCPTIYPGVPETANVRSNTGNFVKITKHKQQDVISLIPTVQVNTTARRRVSFDTHTHDDIPPSPNTRRKNFSFTPISPGSHSPTGRQSKCSSTNASPFVSPRNTPIPRARGNSHPYPLNSSISVRKQFNLSKKSKHELELTIDHNNIKELCKNQVNLPMSAPPSPKTNLLQNLLNSGPKFNYTPNYCSQSGVQAIDQLSPEVSTLLSRNIQSNPEQSTHRSQSVPLNVDPVFNHASFTNQTAINEFNEIDTFPDTNHINVNKIIDTIGQTNLEPFLEQTKLISQNDYIDEAINIQIDAENFCQSENLPNLRERIQNLATDATDMAFLRCNPSRSVPSTPVPHLKANIDSIKQEINYSSRSYPSTPLANESFKYNQTQDYLLNGQPIKEKIASDVNVEMNFLGTMIEKNEMVFDATEVFNDANLNLIPSEHKTNFSFGQISDENNYGAKQNDPILNQESDIENDYFRNDINGT